MRAPRSEAWRTALAAEIDTPDNLNTEQTPARRTRPATTAAKSSPRAIRPIRSIAIFGAVGALVTAIALPAFAAGSGAQSGAATTMHQLAADNAQSLVVASEATNAPAGREGFTATTPEEIEKRKAEEAAALRAAEEAERKAREASNSGGGGAPAGVNLGLTSPGSGEVRWSMTPGSFTVGEGLGAGRGHQGQDMLAPEWTPIFAATSGTVRVAQDNYYGYGNAVVIDGVVGGSSVSTTYAHMVYGGRVVEAGQTVTAGQLIGHVGNTGNSFGSHLHFEVEINGSLVDPLSWLEANAG
ncbi:M23 family metallopeptidase [Microbacterium resistens]|uniref:M23 family metallopeptidase n=2 Tax=Microbacterium resistens TaxID=156977 RepID=A0ABY3RX50_9MICO|nr:M23 family metallopeptidase [Microbacterium resistens]